MTNWEYKSISRPSDELLSDEQLSKIGALGFELVGVAPISTEVTVVGRKEMQVRLHYFFKRPKPAKSGKNQG